MKYSGHGVSEKILSNAAVALHLWNTEGITLDECVEQIRQNDPETARSAASILFEYFRHKSLVDDLITKAASRGSVKEPLSVIAACALSQALFQTAIAKESAVNVAVEFVKHSEFRTASGFVNALLRQALRNAGEGPYPASFPEKLAARWKKTMRSSFEDAVKACSVNPPLTFRLRIPELPEELLHAGCEPVKAEFAGPFRFYTCKEPEILLRSNAFRSGDCYIQDPATAMSAALCQDCVTGCILDACAAPGGKTIMLYDIAKKPFKITAADRSEERTKPMKANFARVGAKYISTAVADAVKAPFADASFDLIFIDAPCSNTGVARRRPDALWRFSGRRVEEAAKLQRRILDSLAPKVKPQGCLLYSTCSVEPDENTRQVKAFLERHPDFELIEEKKLFPTLEHDGAFAAKMERTGK